MLRRGGLGRVPRLEIKNIAVEDKGKFRIEGLVSVREKSLGGAIQLGVAREYLEWLPQRGGNLRERARRLSLDHGALVGNDRAAAAGSQSAHDRGVEGIAGERFSGWSSGRSATG